MAKRGMVVLNVEWFGMGQLRTTGFGHGRMNQLDLVGASGVTPFYLSMSRGIDVLLSHEHADPSRVAVAGLSAGSLTLTTLAAPAWTAWRSAASCATRRASRPRC